MSSPSAEASSSSRTRQPNRFSAKGKNVVMTSHGRLPWYSPEGKNIEAYVIGIAGGSASGKTSVARAILSALNYVPTVLILSQDSFYRKHTQEEIDLAFKSDLDLDHPDSIDTALFAKCLADLKQGRACEIPVYSFVHHQRMPETKYLYGANVIIVEGIMALQSADMRALYDLKVFVNCDSDLMLARRIKRDVKERGRDVDGILDQYLRFVKASYDNFVQPSSKHADIIVPGSSNQLAIDLLVSHIKDQLDNRSLRFRSRLGRDGQSRPLANGKTQVTPSNNTTHTFGDTDEDSGVILLEQTAQLQGIMTILRDCETERGDFIFYADRLSTMIVEKALSLLPHEPHRVQTPVGMSTEGTISMQEDLVGVSILRSGGPFSHGLRRVVRDVPLGAMLIQSDPKTGEPILLSLDLPQSVKNGETSKTVRALLLDSQMGTGAAAMMAIRVLLDHGVPESNIIFLAFLISRRGLTTIRRAFPSVQVVTAAIDPDLYEMHLPLGNAVLGEAAGEGDYSITVVEHDTLGLQRLNLKGDGGDSGFEAGSSLEGYRIDNQNPNQVIDSDRPDSGSGSGFGERRDAGQETWSPTKQQVEELKFSRDRKDSMKEVKQKRAWVVSPGMGHIGDRYYLA
ncbi:uridine kinase family-domain-containing protein [Kockovaella imperatae]|uniref:Uridine kinase n=1 Tax=Kockovaella imperatae TaxID=4999 RepID=A0A1Y1ULA1_9TREE|nr:uridine kinase family-domain-containing protein [Kockovaella imperatae]ORX38266.1 uridine kinase family-domain-containing protein [Kockovaella imperatae]